METLKRWETRLITLYDEDTLSALGVVRVLMFYQQVTPDKYSEEVVDFQPQGEA